MNTENNRPGRRVAVASAQRLLRTCLALTLLTAGQSYAAQTDSSPAPTPAASQSSSQSAAQVAAQLAAAQQLDDEYQKLISSAYSQLAQSKQFTLSSSDLATLLTEVRSADSKGLPDRVAGLSLANMATIQAQIKSKEIAELARLILANHATGIAKDILDYAQKNGDRFSRAGLNFEFAKYYANQNQWDKAIAHLKTFDLTNDIGSQESDEAYIIVGAALQAKKKHREALEYYGKIKPGSPHYVIAQLDKALVYIRQDWWTDAQITMEDAIKAAGKDDIELVNRLYTVMGFSQLQQGFYRNARDSFRNVKINSAYSNRALLGIGMAALNQEDYTGAVNIFAKLKSQNSSDSHDMSVAQAYLLEAFTLAKTQQPDAATAKYTEAINYYGNKVNYYSNLLKSLNENATGNAFKQDETILSEHGYLKTQAEKLDSLARLSGYPLSPQALQQSANLSARLYKIYRELSQEALNKKQAAFNNYLSQSNFGLTRLYDSQ
ncbi:MAG TPA: hypothetical protein VN030_12285 [Cellvibrio sp.]|nr:hypothetical protein [Cellvibrio sp.]